MKRIGIFGGSFNPVHHAHLLVARAAKEALKLDELLLVPCNESAYGKKLMPAKARLAMLRLAVKGVPGFKVSDVELRLGGVSRSIDTLRALMAKEKAGAKWTLLIGQDQVAKFPSWKEAKRLSELAQVCVMARPGFKKSALIPRKFHFSTVVVPQYEISSTQIRQRLKKNLPIDWFVPGKILSFLKSNRSII
jgi:nicotinate-nucleotide adenylyltransferase